MGAADARALCQHHLFAWLGSLLQAYPSGKRMDTKMSVTPCHDELGDAGSRPTPASRVLHRFFARLGMPHHESHALDDEAVVQRTPRVQHSR